MPKRIPVDDQPHDTLPRPTVLGCAFFGIYLVGLTLWTPLFTLWPRRYPGLTWPQSVAVRWCLVRKIWSMVTGRR
jgi:hypothetical protein